MFLKYHQYFLIKIVADKLHNNSAKMYFREKYLNDVD